MLAYIHHTIQNETTQKYFDLIHPSILRIERVRYRDELEATAKSFHALRSQSEIILRK